MSIMWNCSPLHNIKVVLRKLVSTQAKRRGMRAIEVLKKQVYGYISSPTSGCGSFTLVHGVSLSERPLLEIFCLLDGPSFLCMLRSSSHISIFPFEGDTVGGPAVSRQLQITRILMRDLLIGSHGLAHTELRLENVHISPVVGTLGNAADFYEDGPNSSTLDNNMDRRQMMIAFDMRIYDGKNGGAGTHGSINFHEVQIIPCEDECREMIFRACVNFYCKSSVGILHLEMFDSKEVELGCRLEPFILVIGNQTFQKNKFFGCPQASISALTKMAGGAIHGYHEMGSSPRLQFDLQRNTFISSPSATMHPDHLSGAL
ncbi:hypothetical protein D5086_027832 [Populus alba]|uniref:Uncharacterized protein n=1 Tax=Populus alba TaxID=43335 RepID=A0ACC4AWI2_POPAL